MIISNLINNVESVETHFQAQIFAYMEIYLVIIIFIENYIEDSVFIVTTIICIYCTVEPFISDPRGTGPRAEQNKSDSRRSKKTPFKSSKNNVSIKTHMKQPRG